MYVYMFFFFNDTATTEIYTLSLHDALPISRGTVVAVGTARDLGSPHTNYPITAIAGHPEAAGYWLPRGGDRKSTRLNSSHANISYAVFCLKKKKINTYAYYLVS